MALQLFKIADTTVATPQSSIEFTSIPQGYTDLMIFASVRTSRPSTFVSFPRIKPNGSTTNATMRALRGSAGGASSYTDTFLYFSATASTATNNTFGNAFIYIPNYTSSNNKSISIDTVTETNATDSYTDLYASLWSNTAAITSITIDNTYNNDGIFTANSTFTLYGIL